MIELVAQAQGTVGETELMIEGPWWFVIVLLAIQALPQIVKRVYGDDPLPKWMKVLLTSWNGVVPLLLALPDNLIPGEGYAGRLLAASSAAAATLIAYNAQRAIRKSAETAALLLIALLPAAAISCGSTPDIQVEDPVWSMEAEAAVSEEGDVTFHNADSVVVAPVLEVNAQVDGVVHAETSALDLSLFVNVTMLQMMKAWLTLECSDGACVFCAGTGNLSWCQDSDPQPPPQETEGEGA
jgi:hypothetical protein